MSLEIIHCQLHRFTPSDGGPIYAETDMTRFPVEPWNTVTLLPFLFLSLYWLWRLWGRWHQHRVLSCGVPLLLVGFIGGVLYHARRDNPLWFQLDFIPIALLAAIGAGYFWFRLWKEFRPAFLYAAATCVCLVLAAVFGLHELSRQVAISTAYAQLALVLLLPAFVLSRSLQWQARNALLLATLAFSFALTCRVADFFPETSMLLPMGTHWLWHLFGAAAAGAIMQFIYRIDYAGQF